MAAQQDSIDLGVPLFYKGGGSTLPSEYDSAFSSQRSLIDWRKLKASDFTPLRSNLSGLLSLESFFFLTSHLDMLQ